MVAMRSPPAMEHLWSDTRHVMAGEATSWGFFGNRARSRAVITRWSALWPPLKTALKPIVFLITFASGVPFALARWRELRRHGLGLFWAQGDTIRNHWLLTGWDRYSYPPDRPPSWAKR